MAVLRSRVEEVLQAGHRTGQVEEHHIVDAVGGRRMAVAEVAGTVLVGDIGPAEEDSDRPEAGSGLAEEAAAGDTAHLEEGSVPAAAAGTVPGEDIGPEGGIDPEEGIVPGADIGLAVEEGTGQAADMCRQEEDTAGVAEEAAGHTGRLGRAADCNTTSEVRADVR